MIFSYIPAKSYLHRMDPRKRVASFAVLQLAIFQEPFQLVHLLLPLLFLATALGLPRLFRNFARCLLVFSPLFMLSFALPLVFRTGVDPVPGIVKIVYSLLSAELLLATTAVVDFVQLARWLSKKLSFMGLFFEIIVMCFVFLPQMGVIRRHLAKTLKLRACVASRRPFVYTKAFALAFIREMIVYTEKLETSLVLRGYTTSRGTVHFTRARGDSLVVAGVICVSTGSVWLSTLF